VLAEARNSSALDHCSRVAARNEPRVFGILTSTLEASIAEAPMSFSRHVGYTQEVGMFRYLGTKPRRLEMMLTWEQFNDVVAGKNPRRRLATLAEMANVAAFMASDAASAMTGTTVNLCMGTLDD
jgi:NAD(P)-dependent dehydrogenase (short-subunit alcohol dehydrogenase family)